MRRVRRWRHNPSHWRRTSSSRSIVNFVDLGCCTPEGKPLDIAVTTNGHLLSEMAQPLKDAGLHRVTVSMDAVDPDRFARITRVPNGYDNVLAGIRAARRVGLEPVKVNCVLLRGFNEDQIIPFGMFAREEGVVVRFIEFMPLEEDRTWTRDKVVSLEEIVARMSEYKPLVEIEHEHSELRAATVSKTALRNPVSSRPSRNRSAEPSSRIRLTSDGKIRTCLFPSGTTTSTAKCAAAPATTICATSFTKLSRKRSPSPHQVARLRASFLLNDGPHRRVGRAQSLSVVLRRTLIALLLTTGASLAADRTYLGFDRNEYPGDDSLVALHETFSFTGYWLNSPPGANQNTWQGKRAKLKAAGFGFLVLFNGRLYRELKSEAHAKQLGSSDAKAAASTATREGFPPQTIIFLDIEEGGRMLPEQNAYLFSWIDELAKHNFRAGVYCSGMAATGANIERVVTANDIRQHAKKANYFLGDERCLSTVSRMRDSNSATTRSQRHRLCRSVAVCTIAEKKRRRFRMSSQLPRRRKLLCPTIARPKLNHHRPQLCQFSRPVPRPIVPSNCFVNVCG
jgi:molybdenum cofactor biosynthesis enzyme MoaA